MSDRYLWDGSGDPDPEVQRLERLLGRFRYQDRPAQAVIPIRPARPTWLRPALAIAAVLLLAVAGTWITARQPRATWRVTQLEGAPQVGAGRLRGAGRLAVGEVLETDSRSRATISVGEVGQVEVQPNTRVRLLTTRSKEHRLGLDRGLIHAFIWAPARAFFVETPSATAVDLGCTYTIEVDASGAALLRVTGGWVALEYTGRESLTPTGAQCPTRPGFGPGTPYYEDAPEALRSALLTIDFSSPAPDDVTRALAAARPRDAFTLWHVLARVPSPHRERVYDRLAGLVVPPAGVTREGILAGDKNMLDAWWDQLGLEDASWFRLWRGPALK